MAIPAPLTEAQALDHVAGYTLAWSGQYEFKLRAEERLKILLPIVFFAIFALLYMNTRSAMKASIPLF